jgi:hypothetical protein
VDTTPQLPRPDGLRPVSPANELMPGDVVLLPQHKPEPDGTIPLHLARILDVIRGGAGTSSHLRLRTDIWPVDYPLASADHVYLVAVERTASMRCRKCSNTPQQLRVTLEDLLGAALLTRPDVDLPVVEVSLAELSMYGLCSAHAGEYDLAPVADITGDKSFTTR